jgi:hypothetical protein
MRFSSKVRALSNVAVCPLDIGAGLGPSLEKNRQAFFMDEMFSVSIKSIPADPFRGPHLSTHSE